VLVLVRLLSGCFDAKYQVDHRHEETEKSTTMSHDAHELGRKVRTSNGTIDVSIARAHTSGVVSPSADGPTGGHLNNAGAALCPTVVRDAFIAHVNLESSIGSYEAQSRVADHIADVYSAVGELVGAEHPSHEIALFDSSSNAWCAAFYSIPFRRGDVVITCASEYGANIVSYLQMAKRVGIEIIVAPSDANGAIDVTGVAKQMEQIRDASGATTKILLSVSHIPTNGGLVNPCEELGDVAARFDAFYLVDACQTVGQIPVSVNRFKCHALAATSRKYLRGPRGIGFLYVRKSFLDVLNDPVTLDHHGAKLLSPERFAVHRGAQRFEKWESSPAGRIAFGVAVRYALGIGIDAIWQRVASLAAQLRTMLRTVRGVTVMDLGSAAQQCGIVCFVVNGVGATSVKGLLFAQARINVSVSPAASTMYDSRRRQLPDLVRASVHYYNTEAELSTLCKTLASLHRAPRSSL
jgi:selenocysteine lyase/cysteine desulfurase